MYTDSNGILVDYLPNIIPHGHIYVMAGTHHEALHYTYCNDITTYSYLYMPEQLHGVHEAIVYLVGEYYNNPNYLNLMANILSRGLKVVNKSSSIRWYRDILPALE